MRTWGDQYDIVDEFWVWDSSKLLICACKKSRLEGKIEIYVMV
jgi:hypothetical protein